MWIPQISAAVFLVLVVSGADAAARSSYRYYGPAPSLPRVRLREPVVPAPPIVSNLPTNAVFSGPNQLDVYKYNPEPIPPPSHRYRPAKYYANSVVPYLKYYLNAVTRSNKPTASYQEVKSLPGLYGYEMRHYHPNEIDDVRHFRFVVSNAKVAH